MNLIFKIFNFFYQNVYFKLLIILRGEKNIIKKEIENLVIYSCENELSDIINKEIKKGLTVFEAIDKAFEEYKLEEEIILKYENEMEKKINNNPKNLELTSKQIKNFKEKIKKLIYNKYINQIDKISKK